MMLGSNAAALWAALGGLVGLLAGLAWVFRAPPPRRPRH